MEIKFERERLRAGLRLVKDVVSSSADDARYRNIRLESVGSETALLTGSDGSVQIQARVLCKVEGTCALTFAGDRLVAFVNSFDGVDVSIRHGRTQRATITCNLSQFQLAAGDVADLPAMTGPDQDNTSFTISAGSLRGLLRKVEYAASKDRTSPVLSGVLLRTVAALEGIESEIQTVATDGRRLSFAQALCQNVGDAEAVITRDCALTLIRLLDGEPSEQADVLVSFDASSIRVTGSSWSVTAKLVEGKYPHWERVVPPASDLPHRVEFDREIFLANLRRTSLASDGEHPSVCLTVDSRGIILQAQGRLSSATNVVDAKYDGPRTAIHVDPKLVDEIAGRVDDATLLLQFRDGAHPVVFSCETPFKGVVMPMNVWD